MADLALYYQARAAEAARLAENARDEGAKAAHLRFVKAYRERLRQIGAPQRSISA